MICATTGCPAAAQADEFGRRTSVQWNGVTQPLLGPTGHHLLNRADDGTLTEHVATWPAAHREHAAAEVSVEADRTRRYLALLEQVAAALTGDDGVPAR
jgi:hypothetical protein